MMRFLGKLLLSTLAIVLTAEILPGIFVEDPYTAFLVALLLAVLNVTVKPLLVIFTIPLTIFTLGIFLLFINGFIILLAHKLIDGFSVGSFGWAILFSILLSIINSILEYFVFAGTKKDSREP